MSAAHQRVALITGCAKPIGIGSATAKALAAAGIAVMVTDLEERGVANENEPPADGASAWQGLTSLVAEIRDSGGTAAYACGDVSKEDDTSRMVRSTLERFGRIDILVNNAGAPHGRDRGEIEDIPLEAWERVMAINARGPFLMCRAAVPAMRSQQWGRIINVASVAGIQAFPHRGAYSASKAAVMGFTRSLAFDLAAFGITVNAVCPGSVRTTRAMSSARIAGWADVDAGMAKRAQEIPMRRLGDVADVAGVIAFLASDASSYMTGQALVVDGGGLSPA